ncbi:amidohydrolase family protein [Microlunatus sp. Gsoil 973]|uniref:metal-dependent hydrolase family protein n=1 Tax=Microlunatus sp. Gsoil 973 TaxID=2672569 RepID=UPI0012B48A41|nr:amidohydrolase family protein [Microlunatus sp. Gsoil 973]QGN31856.1 amidohydrolase family protein [Microlunatus sp. Gsoil 973]
MAEQFALTHVAIVTGDAAGTVLVDHTILVGAAGRIEKVAPAADCPVPPGYRIIDQTHRFIIPGLINAHAHLFADGRPMPAILLNESVEGIVAKVGHSPLGQLIFKRRTRANAITQLNSGVTTVRSVGDVRYEVVAVAAEIDRGDYLGPRIIASGPLLAVTGGHGAPQIAVISDSPWAARANVRANLRRGATAIKISATGGVTDARSIGEAGRPQMTEEEMTAICEEAHNADVLVAAHAQSQEGVTRALRAGVDTIEHGVGMTEEMIGLFKDNPRSLHGTSALIPTLMACLPLVKLDPSTTGINHIVRANAEMIYIDMLQGIHDALAHDITLGMGTDSALTYATHYNTWREMDYAVRFGGLTPAQALNAATATNARILGISEETGSIEPGRSADLVVLDANPLDGFRTLTEPRLVAIKGSLIERPTVDRFEDVDAQLDSF